MMINQLIRSGRLNRIATGRVVRYSYIPEPKTPVQDDRSPLLKQLSASCERGDIKEKSESLASLIESAVERVVEKLKPEFAEISLRQEEQEMFNSKLVEQVKQRFDNLPMMEDFTNL